MSSDSLPPYFHLSPDLALEDLTPPEGPDGFAEVAEACRAGRDDLASRGLS